MKVLQIEFPWPDPRLSPNKRADRRWITGIRQSARAMGLFLTHQAGVKFSAVPLEITIVICPPDNRWRDDDNIYTSFKSYRDGMFQALELNDKLIRRTILEWGPVRPGGALLVTLRELRSIRYE